MEGRDGDKRRSSLPYPQARGFGLWVLGEGLWPHEGHTYIPLHFCGIPPKPQREKWQNWPSRTGGELSPPTHWLARILPNTIIY